MASDRREFLRRTAAAAAALGARTTPSEAQTRAATMPTPRATALMQAFGLKYPIFNAGMGAFASPDLAIAVTNAGGFGAIGTGAGAVSADAVRQRVSRVKAETKGLFAINYLLAFEPLT